MIEILNRWTKAVMYTNPTATTVAEAISRADLSRADLSRADLSGADLSRADLSGADLSGADLSGADLGGADLSGADLSDADLNGAYLSGADLNGADLNGADLSGAYLSRARGLLSTAVPPLQIQGTRHPIVVRQDGYITIGCIHQPLAWWREHAVGVGKTEGYTAAQVAEYVQHIEHCVQWMLAFGVANVIPNGEEKLAEK